MSVVVAAIRRWLENAFPESNIRFEDDSARGVSRFLIEERAGGRARVLELSAGCAGADPEAIIRHLDREGVARRLKDAPTWRVRLGQGELLEYFQQLHVRCDGKAYYIIQTADRRLVVMDAKHHPLARMPASTDPYEGDITTTSPPQWHERIRAWRGPDQ
jgi:hypothetical protein